MGRKALGSGQLGLFSNPATAATMSGVVDRLTGPRAGGIGGTLPPYSEPTTSRDAAISVAECAPMLRRKVLGAIMDTGDRGATCDELEVALGMSHQTCSARVHELMKSAHIETRGLKRATRSGRKAWVWFRAVAP